MSIIGDAPLSKFDLTFVVDSLETTEILIHHHINFNYVYWRLFLGCWCRTDSSPLAWICVVPIRGIYKRDF